MAVAECDKHHREATFRLARNLSFGKFGRGDFVKTHVVSMFGSVHIMGFPC